MNSKLIFSHLIITLISVFGFGYFYEYIDNNILQVLYAVFHLIIILLLYLASGILATDDEFNFKKYYIIALIGFIIWLVAFINSPDSIDYKHNKDAGLWFFYQLYISGISMPLHDFSLSQKNAYFHSLLLLSLAIIPAIIQAFGGYIKVKQNNKYDS